MIPNLGITITVQVAKSSQGIPLELLDFIPVMNLSTPGAIFISSKAFFFQ